MILDVVHDDADDDDGVDADDVDTKDKDDKLSTYAMLRLLTN